MNDDSKRIRNLILRGLIGGDRGHLGPSMSLVEIMLAVYDTAGINDRVILSKGHGCLAQYAVLADRGIIPTESLDRFCRDGALLGGHPAPHILGVHCHTGSLGNGLSIGMGMVLASRAQGTKRKVFVIMGDGECQEGSVWEALLSANKHRMNELAIIIDRNQIQSAGRTEDICPLGDLAGKLKAFGCSVTTRNGHDTESLSSALGLRIGAGPMAIIANTVKGKGIPFAENDPSFHHMNYFSDDMIKKMREALA